MRQPAPPMPALDRWTSSLGIRAAFIAVAVLSTGVVLAGMSRSTGVLVGATVLETVVGLPAFAVYFSFVRTRPGSIAIGMVIVVGSWWPFAVLDERAASVVFSGTGMFLLWPAVVLVGVLMENAVLGVLAVRQR